MNKIFQFLDSIQKDKWMHYTIGATCAMVGFLLGGLLDFWVGFSLSCTACLVAAFGKEYYDRHHNGRFDCIDFLATELGGMSVSLFLLAAYYWVF